MCIQDLCVHNQIGKRVKKKCIEICTCVDISAQICEYIDKSLNAYIVLMAEKYIAPRAVNTDKSSVTAQASTLLWQI